MTLFAFPVRIFLFYLKRLHLKPVPRPWNWTLKNLDPEKPELRKTWILKSLHPEKPGPRKTWTMKNAGNSWMQKPVKHL